MVEVHYVTYATHSSGTFGELVENPHGVQVKVIGWGTRWNGFGDKIIGVLEYIKILPVNDYVVFIDGFDTVFNRPPDDIIEAFNSYGPPGILASKTQFDNMYISKRLFGTCGGSVANSGMWMGRVGDAVKFLELCKSHLPESNNDDQRAMNTVCRRYPQMKVVVDHKYLVFQNRLMGKCAPSAIFCSYPGTGGGGVNVINRQVRKVREYTPFFRREISWLCVALLVIAVAIYICRQRRGRR